MFFLSSSIGPKTNKWSEYFFFHLWCCSGWFIEKRMTIDKWISEAKIKSAAKKKIKKEKIQFFFSFFIVHFSLNYFFFWWKQNPETEKKEQNYQFGFLNLELFLIMSLLGLKKKICFLSFFFHCFGNMFLRFVFKRYVIIIIIIIWHDQVIRENKQKRKKI